jgi:hypothetical protein
MTEPEAAQVKIVSAPRLPVAALLELHRLCNSILSSPDVATHQGDRNETTGMSQPGLFDQIAQISSPLPMDLHQSVIVQLAQLMRAVIEAIDKEVGDEQD